MLMTLLTEENKCYNYLNFIIHVMSFNLWFYNTGNFYILYMIKMDLHISLLLPLITLFEA